MSIFTPSQIQSIYRPHLQDVLHSREEGIRITYCDAEVPYGTSEHTVQTAVYNDNRNIVE